MVDGLVDLINGLLEAVAGQRIVAAKLIFKIQKLLLKTGNIQILIPHCLQFPLVLQGIHGSIPQNGDDLNKKLRADHVHLRIPVGHVHDARIIVIIIRLQQCYQHRILTALLPAVLVQFF